MTRPEDDRRAIAELGRLAAESGLDVAGGTIRRSSSRFCLGVEHGDYNGTELFGVGTDRFIWLACKPNGSDLVRLFSGNFAGDGVVSFTPGRVPSAKSSEIADTWARFPCGVDWVLGREGITLSTGVDVVLHGNIPGGGMSRSASLTLNLLLSLLEANDIELDDPMRIAVLAQGAGHEAVVARVMNRRMKNTVQTEELIRVVELDLVAGALGNLHNDVDDARRPTSGR